MKTTEIQIKLLGRTVAVCCNDTDKDRIIYLAQKLNKRFLTMRKKSPLTNDFHIMALENLVMMDQIENNQSQTASQTTDTTAGCKDITDDFEHIITTIAAQLESVADTLENLAKHNTP